MAYIVKRVQKTGTFQLNENIFREDDDVLTSMHRLIINRSYETTIECHFSRIVVYTQE